MYPRSFGEIDHNGVPAGVQHRRHHQVRPDKKLLIGQAVGILIPGVVQEERTHHGQPRAPRFFYQLRPVKAPGLVHPGKAAKIGQRLLIVIELDV